MNKKLLAAAVAGAVTAPLTAQALDFDISGHINRAVRFADDGQASDIQHLDATASRSRWAHQGLRGSGQRHDCGLLLRGGHRINRTFGQALKATDGTDDPAGSNLRHSMVWFSGTWGTINLGTPSRPATAPSSSHTTCMDGRGVLLGRVVQRLLASHHCGRHRGEPVLGFPDRQRRPLRSGSLRLAGDRPGQLPGCRSATTSAGVSAVS